jgi:hypothetical protein
MKSPSLQVGLGQNIASGEEIKRKMKTPFGSPANFCPQTGPG